MINVSSTVCLQKSEYLENCAIAQNLYSCSSCELGYTNQIATDEKNYICKENIANCKDYSSNTTCLLCKTGFYL